MNVRSLEEAKTMPCANLLGHQDNTVGLIVTSVDPVKTDELIGVIVSSAMRMPYPFEPANDVQKYYVLFDRKFRGMSRIELERDFIIHQSRVFIPPEGVKLSANPSTEVRRQLSALMDIVHQYDYLKRVAIQKH